MDHFTIKPSATSITASIQPKQYQRYASAAKTMASQSDSDEQLPAYSEIMKDRPEAKVVKKEVEVEKSKKQSKLAALKSKFKSDEPKKQSNPQSGWKGPATGKHPVYRLDESMSGQMRYLSG